MNDADDPAAPDGETSDERPDDNEKAESPWPPHSVFERIGKQYNQLFANLSSPLIKNLTTGFSPLNTANWFPQIKTVDLLPNLDRKSVV